MYLDTCYIVKFYFNEPESSRVRELVRKADTLYSSLWAFAEFHAVLHRRIREGSITHADARDLASRFGHGLSLKRLQRPQVDLTRAHLIHAQDRRTAAAN